GSVTPKGGKHNVNNLRETLRDFGRKAGTAGARLCNLDVVKNRSGRTHDSYQPGSKQTYRTFRRETFCGQLLWPRLHESSHTLQHLSGKPSNDVLVRYL